MKRFLKHFTYLSLVFTLQFNAVVFAMPPKEKNPAGTYNIRELALPSEVEGLSKKTGSVFYTPTVKGKVLMPVHFWGEVSNAGIHFIPVDTTLINGLSIAGGPRTDGRLDNVKLTRSVAGKIQEYNFDLSDGGDEVSYREVLKPGDTIFVDKSRFYENRAYYTSLVGVIATVLSSILLYREVKK